MKHRILFLLSDLLHAGLSTAAHDDSIPEIVVPAHTDRNAQL